MVLGRWCNCSKGARGGSKSTPGLRPGVAGGGCVPWWFSKLRNRYWLVGAGMYLSGPPNCGCSDFFSMTSTSIYYIRCICNIYRAFFDASSLFQEFFGRSEKVQLFWFSKTCIFLKSTGCFLLFKLYSSHLFTKCFFEISTHPDDLPTKMPGTLKRWTETK